MLRSLIILITLSACTREETRLKRHNEAGEYIQRKDGERGYLSPTSKPSSRPVYPWSKRFAPDQKIHLEE